MFNNNQLRIIQFCAASCERQKSGERSVFDMVRAYQFAMEVSPPDRPFPKRLTLVFIEELGRKIEPTQNAKGFRTEPVFKEDPNTLEGSGIRVPIGSPWERIEDHIIALIASTNLLTSEEFYKNFEEIHPFVDGNGRAGDILFNYLNGTMTDPVVPPWYWNTQPETGKA